MKLGQAALHSWVPGAGFLLFPELTVVVWTMVVGSLFSGRCYPVDQ